MPTTVLGKYSFTDTPDVNGLPVLTGVTLTGDVTGTGGATVSTTLANNGVTPGTYKSVTVNAKGLVTAGTSNPNSLVAYYTGQISATSGTATIPTDTSTPLITEGTQLWSQTITPSNVNSKIIFNMSCMCDSSSNNRNISFVLFRDSTCIYATAINVGTAGRPQSVSIYTVDLPNTTATITYTMRVGNNSSGSWYINQSNGGVITFGGTVNKSNWAISEIL